MMAVERHGAAMGVEVACLHCGLPTRPADDSADAFCCSGCRIAFAAIRAAGLDDTYYRLRRLAPGDAGRPSDTPLDNLTLAYLASPDYTRRHGKTQPDGSCQLSFHVEGLHCAACSWLVEQVAAGEPGVGAVEVDLPGSAISLDVDPEAADLPALANRLRTFGYSLLPLHAASSKGGQQRSLLIRAGICWALAGNVMLLAFAMYSGLDASQHPGLAAGAAWASSVLTFISVLVGGSVFFRRAAASVTLAARTRQLTRLHMDVPISLGILVGFSYSAVNTATGGSELWFDSIAVLIAALLTARWLQVRGQERARDATNRLFAVIPRVARRIDVDGTESVVPLEEIGRDNLVRVEPGESCPVDGSLVSGRTHFDQSVLTGESRPVPLTVGDRAFAGSLNLGSTVLVRAASAGNRSQIGKLLEWLNENRTRKAPTVVMADRIAGGFVAAVLVLAVATAVIGFHYFPHDALDRVVALLVIACPCALGMATPLAMVTARGRAARRGLLIKDDATVEALSRAETVVLDKTGTVTVGRLELVDTFGDARWLALAAAVEHHSGHPIARAVCAAVAADGDAAHDVEEHWGSGISGTVDNAGVAVGSPAWVSLSARDPHGLQGRAAEIAAEGLTPVSVAVDGEVRLVLALGDALRPDAGSTVAALRALGKRIVLLSGDHPEVVRSVAKALGIVESDAIGGATPRDKERFVTELRRTSQVAMVGDGINDSTAMRAAHVGIALGSKNAPAVVAADVLINSGRFGTFEALLDLSRNARRVVRANLTFSLLYNVVGAAAAGFGLVTPLVAAIAMPVSSLAVVSSSLLLNYSRRLR